MYAHNDNCSCSKGVPIDTLDNKGKNCLDIAIGKGHRNVIKTLLEDENWESLFRVDGVNYDDNLDLDEITIVDYQNKSATISMNQHMSSIGRQPVTNRVGPMRTENQQLVGLFELKMWDMIELILDKTLLKVQGHDGFGIIDKHVKSMSIHPLTLIARSGQENLVKHETTLLLLSLKWRFLPRLAFYVNILICMLFMAAISAYAILIIGSNCNSFNGLIEKIENTSCREYNVQCEPYRGPLFSSPNVTVICPEFTTEVNQRNETILLTCNGTKVSGLPKELECDYLEREVCAEIPIESESTEFVTNLDEATGESTSGFSAESTFDSMTTLSSAVSPSVFTNFIPETTTPRFDQNVDYIVYTRDRVRRQTECNGIAKYVLKCSAYNFECNNPEIRCSDYNQLITRRNCLIREESPLVVDFVLIMTMVNSVKLFIQFLGTDNKSFLLSFQTWFEAGIYTCAAISIYSLTYELQNVLASITVLGSFLLFPLYLQKVRVFGVYVLALKRTVENSLKFLPLVIILLAGFIIGNSRRMNLLSRKVPIIATIFIILQIKGNFEVLVSCNKLNPGPEFNTSTVELFF